MNPEEWRRGGAYFQYEGKEIFYRREREATGENLLCLHGFPTASFDYRKIWRGLAEKFSPVAFDLIGYGFSDKPKNFQYTTHRQVDVLERLVAHLKIEKLHILAHDYGNTITQELLARRGENRLLFEIETVCFLNGALFPETHRPILAQKILISPAGFLFGRLIPDFKFKRALASVFGGETQPSPSELDDFLYLFKRGGGRKISHKLIRYMREREIYRERWVGALEKMRQPFRFINGLADPVSGRHLVERFREVLPALGKDVVELEDIGHFPHFEAPEKTLGHFLKFHEKI